MANNAVRGLREQRLRRALPVLDQLVAEGKNALSPEFQHWQETVEVALEELFGGANSSYADRFKSLGFLNLRVGPITWNSGDQERFEHDIVLARGIISDAMEELDVSSMGNQGSVPFAEDSDGSAGKHIRLFISHSSRDVEYVEQLIDLLRSALELPAAAIRCTSVDGYRLPGGVDTKQRLRTEIHYTDAFVGVITADSLSSNFVLFELGARWGAAKHLVPLLAGGVDPDDLGPPVSDLNALRGDTAGGLAQLIGDLGDHLNIHGSSPAAYQARLLAVAAAGARLRMPGAAQKQATRLVDLSEEAKTILLEAVKDDHPSILCVRTFGGLTIQVNRKVLTENLDARATARYQAGLRQLVDFGYIRETGRKGEVFELLHEGYEAAATLAKEFGEA